MSDLYTDPSYANQPQASGPLPPAPPTSHHNRGGKFNDLLSTFGIIIMAPLVALFLTQFIFQSYQVDGPSMEHTLQDHDRLIVTKTGKTWSRITHKNYVPKRYEIIIFNHSGEFGNGNIEEKQLVKRVIGLPGDRVLVKDGVVTIYNKEHPGGFLIDREGPEKDTIRTTPGNIDENVKDGELYVMGDNRENSLDSRYFGAIRSQDVVGKLALRIYPFDKAEKF